MPRPALAAASCLGLGCAAALVAGTAAGRPLLALAVAVVAGVAVVAVARALGVGPRATLVIGAVTPVVGALTVASLLVVPVAVVPVAVQLAASLTAWAGWRGQRVVARVGALAGPVLSCAGLVLGAGAWSVDEPPGSSGRTPGNGVDVAVDTHAFLVQQGTVVLASDGRTAEAAFLRSSDPTAPLRADGTRQSYLWRVQPGARDADRVLKATQAPDHFFNWWTHSGKGTVAGTSGATWAEQQFARATRAWEAGDRSEAMYRLGVAVHLVDDACAPPHASPYVPDHRAYEEWVVHHQAEHAVTRGGIYSQDFRITSGHGGREWSSEHPRGWVDECAHRAAELVVNTAQPPPDDPADAGSYEATAAHFRDAQRLTAGFLAFFFDTVGGP